MLCHLIAVLNVIMLNVITQSLVAAGTHLNRIKVMKKNSLKSFVIGGQYYKLFTATSGVFLYDFD